MVFIIQKGLRKFFLHIFTAMGCPGKNPAWLSDPRIESLVLAINKKATIPLWTEHTSSFPMDSQGIMKPHQASFPVSNWNCTGKKQPLTGAWSWTKGSVHNGPCGIRCCAVPALDKVHSCKMLLKRPKFTHYFGDTNTNSCVCPQHRMSVITDPTLMIAKGKGNADECSVTGK